MRPLVNHPKLPGIRTCPSSLTPGYNAAPLPPLCLLTGQTPLIPPPPFPLPGALFPHTAYNDLPLPIGINQTLSPRRFFSLFLLVVLNDVDIFYPCSDFFNHRFKQDFQLSQVCSSYPSRCPLPPHPYSSPSTVVPWDQTLTSTPLRSPLSPFPEWWPLHVFFESGFSYNKFAFFQHSSTDGTF